MARDINRNSSTDAWLKWPCWHEGKRCWCTKTTRTCTNRLRGNYIRDFSGSGTQDSGERRQPSFWELNNPFQKERMIGAGPPPPAGKPGNCGFCRTGRGGSFGAGGPNTYCGYNYGCIIAGGVLAYFLYKKLKK